ncbi:MAG TPA: Fic family protein [Candidatus Kapabacteria bacterium]|nr:Fic family protein [Candidatus Kapabacteria bacterium]HPO62679.1 Fic family protein [Candidatus Kapabacteria bacterium]
MKISNFIAGKYIERYQYSSFEPNSINFAWEIDVPEVNFLLSEADLKLGELNAFSQLIPDVDFFIRMHVAKESTLSSKIEGTQTSIEDTVQKEENISNEQRDDWLEVNNYIISMNHASKRLSELPISNRLIKETHHLLLQGARGRNKTPGEFRHSQNWIGGATLKDAYYIPPSAESIPELMSDLERFINNDTIAVPHLIKIGITHYQFETIHPFLDGNGRIGRLLIPLYLISNNILTKPTLYLSEFFERNRMLYYDNLSTVHLKNNLAQWLKFFLVGVKQTAEKSIFTLKEIIKLRDECICKISELGKKSINAKHLLYFLFKNPIIDAKDVSKELEVSTSTAIRFLDDFIRIGILKERTGFQRNRQYSFEKYIDLFRK